MSLQPEPSWHGANPDEPDFRDTLHERYRHLRKVAPVNLTPRGYVRLCRHADCERLLKRTKVGVRTVDGTLPSVDETHMARAFMLEQDPPHHTRLRRMVSRYFTPRVMEELQLRVDELCEELVDGMDSREVDLVQSLALPLPSIIISEIMGVPAEERAMFNAWSNDLTYILLGTRASRAQQSRANAALGHMVGYITEKVQQRRREPTEDLIGVLVRAEQEGEQLSEIELLWQCVGLTLAGFETTTGLIANGVRQLLLHPDQWRRLHEDRTLAASAVDEVLRYEPSVAATSRCLHEDAQFGDIAIERDTVVMAVLAAANRDPEVFDAPATFDIGRQPNPHMGFGGGIHMCLGAHLAKIEAMAAFRVLSQRYPGAKLLSPHVQWSSSLLRIPQALPLCL